MIKFWTFLAIAICLVLLVSFIIWATKVILIALVIATVMYGIYWLKKKL